jgi:hypothetical protein
MEPRYVLLAIPFSLRESAQKIIARDQGLASTRGRSDRMNAIGNHLVATPLKDLLSHVALGR